MPDSTPYPPDVKAEALELIKVDGLSQHQVAAVLSQKYPERAPTQQSISVWCAQDEDISRLCRERQRDLWADQIALNTRLFDRANSQVDHLGGNQAIIAQAIGLDKELKIMEALTGPKAGSTTTNNVLVIVKANKPEDVDVEAIDGEAREVR